MEKGKEEGFSKGPSASPSSSSPYRNSPSVATAVLSPSHRRSPSTGASSLLNVPNTITPSPSHTRSRSTGNPTSTAAKFAMSLAVREDEETYRANDFDGYELVEFGPKSTNEGEEMSEDFLLSPAASAASSRDSESSSTVDDSKLQQTSEAAIGVVASTVSASSSSQGYASKTRRRRNACRKCKTPFGIYCEECKRSFVAAKELLKGMKEKIKVCRRENRQLQKNINDHLKKSEMIRRKQQEIQLHQAKIDAQKKQLYELRTALEHETVFAEAYQQEIKTSSKALEDAQRSFIQRRQYLDRSFGLQENSKLVIDFSKELNRLSSLQEETERALFAERQRVCHELQCWLCVINAVAYPEHTRVFNQILPNNISDFPHVITAAELAAAFGNIIQFISHLCSYLDISLPYPLEFGASRSYIYERDESQKFPLFGKLKEVEQGMTRLCSNVEYMCFSEGLIINDRAMLLPNILGLLGSPSLGRPGLRGYHSILFYTPRNSAVPSATIQASASCSALVPPPTPSRKAASATDSPSEASPSINSNSSTAPVALSAASSFSSSSSAITTTPPPPSSTSTSSSSSSNTAPAQGNLHSSTPLPSTQQLQQQHPNPQRSFSLFNIFNKKDKEEEKRPKTKGRATPNMNRSKDNIDQGWEIVDDDL
eukprot:TRINITY_DN918_c0_g1_i1.p1 TRINITY_DN918_c0_g1~~TRINITY_DN918_c0_g1_i1.p1  ORF type:complete len:655 (+),score=177.34 TRINITY_DN918_c0_g1_i1:232-2196(+)